MESLFDLIDEIKDEDGWSAIKYAQEAGDGIKQEVVDYLKSIN